MFPKNATASVTGIGGLFGGIGGLLLTFLIQKGMFIYYESIGQIETGYFIMFIICGSAYLIAWLIMHFLVPQMKKVDA
jgi:MFS transporter, ACS family, hexuronate transporter